MCLTAGVLQLLLAFGNEGVPLFLGAFQRVFRLVPGLLHLILRGFQLKLQVIQLGQHAVQTLIITGHVAAGCVNDGFRDAQLGADEKGVGFARHTHAEPVGGHEALHIEFAAGVYHAGGLQRVDLQLRIVGGGHDKAPLPPQLLQQADRQRRTLGRVSAGTQLVQQRQRAGTGQFQNPGDAFHVAGEGGQALLDALLVTDIHQIFLKMTDGAVLVGRNQKSILRHGIE